mmetsp:Transcript_20089/g.29811  ORF Transcript_20089/g.29811 Transcript_20089/m.29811 type:complete len:441 (+) Transcript_20089:124-1446(+)|eukprot:CAMPEP_0194204414 /NCGR_PEP_ID=MMETSP0156-20130528/3935_1 /TAXON_ID=33649 /ORGANISM="Thalassionema nitzschioides, Strain L26-B" /LENGTH=440 /DNA_ID=CAMNT_0038930415 /DNA_START=121 /DNA_END=1443 /DNA_ORIENTATION=+
MNKRYSISTFAALAAVTLLAVYSTIQNCDPTRFARGLRFDNEEDEKYVDDKNFRVVSFGTSRAWGSGLQDPSTQTYTALLNGTNKAIRASMADYPAMCTYSMLGDEVYDIITIEYLPQSYNDCKDNLVELGRRLRQRYPDALIIYINVWSNHQFSVTLPDDTQGYLRTLIAERKLNDENITLADVASDLQYANRWEFQASSEAWLREQLKDPSIRAEVLHYDLPNKDNYVSSIIKLSTLYLGDLTHFNEYGHRWVASEIRKIVREKQHTRKNTVNAWSNKDSCESWIQSGKSKVTTNMAMVPFSNGAKFALESSKGRMKKFNASNYFVLENDSDKDQHFYLSHMASGPNNTYGDGLVQIYEVGLEFPASYNVTVDTAADWATYQIHIIKHDYIGKIKPGTSYVVVENKDVNFGWNFRTVGYIMSPTPHAVKNLHGELERR